MKPHFILPLLFFTTLSIKNCVSDQSFNKDNRDFLGDKSIAQFFLEGKFLGKGSFGTVVEANWRGNPIAIKRVDKPKDPGIIKIQEDELTYMKMMQGQKAVVELIACVETGTNLYIMIEKMYKDLESATLLVVYKNKLVAERLEIFKKILQKFSILHKNRIIHEDIKPENVMSLDKEMRDFRIIDLGLSVIKDAQVIGGTPTFNSPEKVPYMPSQADPRHDVYALGLTFAVLESSINEIFSGITTTCLKVRYGHTCHNNLMANIDKALIRSGMAEMIPIIRSACAYDLAYRYASVDDLIKSIDDLLKEMAESNKSLLIESDLSDLLKSKRAAEVETDANKKAEAEKGYLEQDGFYKQNQQLFKPVIKTPDVEENQLPDVKLTMKKMNTQEDPNVQIVDANHVIIKAYPNPIHQKMENVDFDMNGYHYTWNPKTKLYTKTPIINYEKPLAQVAGNAFQQPTHQQGYALNNPPHQVIQYQTPLNNPQQVVQHQNYQNYPQQGIQFQSPQNHPQHIPTYNTHHNILNQAPYLKQIAPAYGQQLLAMPQGQINYVPSYKIIV